VNNFEAGYNQIAELVIAKFGYENLTEIAFAIDKRRAWHKARNRNQDVEFWKQVMEVELGPRLDVQEAEFKAMVEAERVARGITIPNNWR